MPCTRPDWWRSKTGNSLRSTTTEWTGQQTSLLQRKAPNRLRVVLRNIHQLMPMLKLKVEGVSGVVVNATELRSVPSGSHRVRPQEG